MVSFFRLKTPLLPVGRLDVDDNDVALAGDDRPHHIIHGNGCKLVTSRHFTDCSRATKGAWSFHVAHPALCLAEPPAARRAVVVPSRAPRRFRAFTVRHEFANEWRCVRGHGAVAISLHGYARALRVHARTEGESLWCPSCGQVRRTTAIDGLYPRNRLAAAGALRTDHDYSGGPLQFVNAFSTTTTRGRAANASALATGFTMTIRCPSLVTSY